MASLPDATSRSSQAAITFSARIARVPPGTREDERHAGDRAVLHPLRAGRAHDGDAPRLEVEHRHPLRVAHQRLRAGAGREPHLDASRGVGRAEERLRPRRVVAVDEDLLGAVDRERLGVGDEPVDRELEVAALLDRALGHHAGPPGLRADEQRDRVQGRVAGDADGRLQLGEAPRRRLGRVGGEQGRALLQVRHVRLVGGRAARPQLLQREHQLDRVEQAGDARELRGRQARARAARARPAGTSTSTSIRAISPSGSAIASAATSRSSPCATRKRSITSNSAAARPSMPHDDAVLDDELRLGIVRPVQRDEPELRQRASRAARAEAPSPRARRSGRTRSATDEPPLHVGGRRPRGRKRPSRGASQPSSRRAHSSSSAAVERPAAARCRSRAAGRRGRRRARLRARGCRRAAGARPRARPRPGGAASRAWRERRSATSVPARAASSVTSSSARPDGVSTRSGRREPSG